MNGMKSLYFIVLFQSIIILSRPAKAQFTYVGFEAAINEDQNSVVNDTGGELNSVPVKSILWGINIRKDLNPKLFIESAIINKVFWQSIVFNQQGNTPYPAYTFYTLQVPLRVGYIIRLTKKIYLVPEPGVSLAVNGEPANSFGLTGSTSTISGGKINYSTKNLEQHRFFILLNPTLKLEIKLFSTLLLSFYVGHSWGVTKISQFEVDYNIDNSPTYNGSIVNKGYFFYEGISLKYPITRSKQKSE